MKELRKEGRRKERRGREKGTAHTQWEGSGEVWLDKYF